MARLFDDAASEYLTYAGGIVSAYPWTMACWAYSNDDTDVQYAFGLGDANAAHFWAVYFRGDVAGDIIRFGSYNAVAFKYCDTTSGFTANTWHHICAVAALATDRRIFIDGGNKGTNAEDNTPTGIDTTGIGRLYYNGGDAGNHMSGGIAEVGLWNVALTDAEVASLADGFSPLFIHPQNLVAYWPLVRGLNDRVGGYNVTANGTTVIAHPRVIYPAAPMIITAPAAVGANAPTGVLYGPLVGAMGGPI